MKSLSLRSKFNWLAASFNGLLAFSLIIETIRYGFSWQPALTLGLGLIIWIWVYIQSRHWFAPLYQLTELVQRIAQGQFEQRITGISESHEIGKLCWCINDMLDQLECYFRDVATAVQYHIDDKFFRKAIPTGLHGEFRSNIENRINVSLSTIAKVNDHKQRNELLAKLQHLNSSNSSPISLL
jgi:nitrogen fixation/metabolism regulation signal transduction histidine kinase